VNVKAEIVIIGMGPAGLGAALNLIEAGVREEIVVIDRGRPLDHRPCPADSGHLCLGCNHTCNVVSGFGGSMHDGDALKLSLFPSGRRLQSRLPVDCALQHNPRIFKTFSVSDSDFVSPSRIPGLNTKSYPVASVSAAAVRRTLDGLVEKLSASKNVKLHFGCELQRIEHSADGFVLHSRTRNIESMTVDARFVVVAVGRSGLFWWKPELRRIGLRHTSPVCSIGFRFEGPSEYFKSIGAIQPDLKTTIHYGSVKTKTFCFCAGKEGGKIKYVDYGKFTLLDGHLAIDEPSETANFAVLAQLLDSRSKPQTVEDIEASILSQYVKLNEGFPGKPVIQWAPDFVQMRYTIRSMEEFKNRTGWAPRFKQLACAKLYDLVSEPVHAAICNTFLKVLEVLIRSPAGRQNEMLPIHKFGVSGLELEGLWDVLEVSEELETSIPNLFAIGDCNGLAQGVYQAMISGYAASDAIKRRLSPIAAPVKASVRLN
jgi:uncharacterized FAD-dependent dehydrogenase